MVTSIKKMVSAGVVVAVMMVAAGSAHAFIGVNWLSTGMTDMGLTPLDNTLMQLIWSMDGNMDPMGSNVGPGADPVGDDLLLDSMMTGTAEPGYVAGMGGYFGVTYDNTDLAGNGAGDQVSDAQFKAGHIYVRVFDASAPSGLVPNYYTEGGWVETLADSPAFPNQYNSSTITGSATDMQMVPEPGTMALFALGLSTLAIRRRRR